ncbi:MAG: 23S rRNA (uracil(1939)-C(5))-methyltransferase RlmD [Bacteroidales bacterium]|nr:23S rRNA (uracil(1939)-C(5))-methyltransferase RlmD [Bacteroidales bacterium]
MARNKKMLPILEAVKITDVAAEGKALARVNDMVVFVPYVAPGDVVDIQLTRKKHKYAEGRVVRFHEYSKDREKPFCDHFGVCGGCKWQQLPYQAQINFKQKQVYDALTRIGKIDLPDHIEKPVENSIYPHEGFYPIMGSKKTKFYRNKLEFTFSDKRWMTYEEVASGASFESMNALGFHIPGMFDKVLDIEKCWLQDDISNRIRLSIRSFCLENNYEFFNLKNQEGLMRNLIVRTASTGEVMLIVVFFREKPEKIASLLQHVSSNFPEITSLIYIINEKANDTIGDQEIHVFKGRDHIFEGMEGLKFKIGPKSFYQTNSEQAYVLYQVARSFAGLKGNELVYDLYTGTGTIALFLARFCKAVIGVESVPEAIEDAKVNAELNGLNNTQFFSGDMKDVLNNSFIDTYGRPDVIITDPPRTGMHADVVNTIINAGPERIVYVSCNPATQARDLALLDFDYQVTKVQPVDMFPHTQHVENVVLLEKRAVRKEKPFENTLTTTEIKNDKEPEDFQIRIG